MASNEFQKISYQLHESHYNQFLFDEEKIEQVKSWSRTDTVDAWRHLRMYSSLEPLLLSFPEAQWMTVGDGRYGSDAHYIQQKGIRVVATDISDSLLIKAQQDGYIHEYKRENAEALSFADNTFDVVFCKETYHHLPRPTIALYEMLRVAKKGVVLIEPNDIITPSTRINSINKFKSSIKKIGNSNTESTYYPNGWEEVGNYVYTISEREIEKIALGLGLNVIAFKGLNDSYIEGVEYEKADTKSKLFKRIKFKIWFRDFLCKLGLQSYSILVAIIFKESPDTNVRNKFLKQGFKLIDLPQNPYVSN